MPAGRRDLKSWHLTARLQNDAETELREAVEQQRQIIELRIKKWLEHERHLHTRSGHRARHACEDVPVRLERQKKPGDWRLLGSARTDRDGRCANLLGEDAALAAGDYRPRLIRQVILQRKKLRDFIR